MPSIQPPLVSSFRSSPIARRRVRLDDGEEYEYEDGAFWVSIGVLAVLDIVVATLYIIAAVRAFR